MIFCVNTRLLTAPLYDRYLAIRYPLRSREMRTPKNALTSICLVWGMSLVFSSPYRSYYRLIDLDGSMLCIPAWEARPRRAMDIFTFVFGYRLPVVVLSLTYARTIRYLWTTVDPMKDMSEIRRSKRKVTKMIIIVAVLFCLCWLPHHLVLLCMWSGHFPLNHVTYVLRILSHLVADANSCLNPIVYALVSKHFRKGFRKVFGCAFRKSVVNKVHVVQAVHTVSSVEGGSSETSNQSQPQSGPVEDKRGLKTGLQMDRGSRQDPQSSGSGNMSSIPSGQRETVVAPQEKQLVAENTTSKKGNV